MRPREINSAFPIWSVQEGFVINKRGAISILFELQLPSIFTVSNTEYNSLHTLFANVLKRMPPNTIIHKQDWIKKCVYEADYTRRNKDFLSQTNERSFEGREFYDHTCYVAFTIHEGVKVGFLNTLLGLGDIVPSNYLDEKYLLEFEASANEALSLLRDQTPGLDFKRLREDTLLNPAESYFIRYINLSFESCGLLSDILLKEDHLVINDRHVHVYTITDMSDFSLKVSNQIRMTEYSGEHTDVYSSFGAALGLLLPCDHIFNQVFICHDQIQVRAQLSQQRDRLKSFSSYDSRNAINTELISDFLDSSMTDKSIVSMHHNVITFSEPGEIEYINSLVKSAALKVGITLRRVMIENKDIFFGSMLGNSTEIPEQLTYLTTNDIAACYVSWETNGKDDRGYYEQAQLPYEGMFVADRLTLTSRLVDIWQQPYKNSLVPNRNFLVVGPSGTGKSFFTNHMMSAIYRQGGHLVLIDVGNSYEVLCKMHQGTYLKLGKESKIEFNPFLMTEYDENRVNFLITPIVLTIYGLDTITETEKTFLSKLIQEFYRDYFKRGGVGIELSMNGFYQYVMSDQVNCKIKHSEFLSRVQEANSLASLAEEDRQKVISAIQELYYARDNFERYFVEAGNSTTIESKLKEQLKAELSKRKRLFDYDRFELHFSQFTKGGKYEDMLNHTSPKSFEQERFIVFELEEIKEMKDIFPIVVVMLIYTYMEKIFSIDNTIQKALKVLLIEEAWSAMMNEEMAKFMKWAFKTVRKHNGMAGVVTQAIEDLTGNEFVKGAIIGNTPTKILMNLEQYQNHFDEMADLCGFTKEQVSTIMSAGRNMRKDLRYREFTLVQGNEAHVYALLVSKEEVGTYTTDKTEKQRVLELVKEYGIQEGLTRFANE